MGGGAINLGEVSASPWCGDSLGEVVMVWVVACDWGEAVMVWGR